MWSLQLGLLDHFAKHCPHLFLRHLHVWPEVFDCILDQISSHPIFHSSSENHQLPVAIQLATFLFHVGHYGNVASPEDMAQWARVSVGLVINFTNWVMVTILGEHDTFVNIPPHDLEDMERVVHTFTELQTCLAWRNGIFAADGSLILLFKKPQIFGESFYDRKSRYLLNCQVCIPMHAKWNTYCS
ncbi:hypothetical protein BKA82DRAFT_155785 [Pisolithus tinctorius]|uniref:Uncharacterized protein n=1 Tax=Pisolithus tinctorius Marx 270 TaxID=870435 RepID=A0A0C3NUY5_PISTI|nr:hypothetical protein BKA82DRAFT_155785 [Pisolithus tinctorius]KIN99225.1 hypothetical protein M404DRAFT_155785 [Pisolithus tinctorius Marx 270]